MSETYQYQLDTTGVKPENLISREQHTLTDINSRSHRMLVPIFAPFHLNNLKLVRRDPLGIEHDLHIGVDFEPANQYLTASDSIGAMLFGSIVIHNTDVAGSILFTYQTLGGKWMADRTQVLSNMATSLYNPRIAAFDQLTNVQDLFPPLPHDQDLKYVYDSGELVGAIGRVRDAIVERAENLVVKPSNASRTPESFFFRGR